MDSLDLTEGSSRGPDHCCSEGTKNYLTGNMWYMNGGSGLTKWVVWYVKVGFLGGLILQLHYFSISAGFTFQLRQDFRIYRILVPFHFPHFTFQLSTFHFSLFTFHLRQDFSPRRVLINVFLFFVRLILKSRLKS